MLTVGYLRVSSDEQALHGVSIDAQRGVMNGYRQMMELPELPTYEDAGFSGKNMNRPALRRLLADCEAGKISTVVVWKLDRLSRSLRDTLHIMEDVFKPRGISLVSTTESIDTSTPAGRMMLNMLASFAQLEREQDSDRVVMAHKHLARDCRYLGGHVPFGYLIDEDKHYQLHPLAAPLVRRVFELYLARAGYAPILDLLNGEAFALSGKRSPWKKSDINYLLNNEIYAGVYVHRMGEDKRSRITSPEIIRVPGGVPAIVTPEEWQRVEEIREENKRKIAMYKTKTVYPLTGLVRCAKCKKLMQLNHGGKARDGSVERYYTCKDGCVKPARLEKLEAAVWQALGEMADSEDLLRRSVAIVNDYAQAADEDGAADAKEIDKQIIAIRKKQAELATYIKKSPAEAPAILLDELANYEKQIKKLESKKEKALTPATRYDAEATVRAVKKAVEAKEKPPEERKEALQAAVHHVEVTDEEFTVILAWHTCGGDDPPLYVCHVIKRHSSGGCVTSGSPCGSMMYVSCPAEAASIRPSPRI